MCPAKLTACSKKSVLREKVGAEEGKLHTEEPSRDLSMLSRRVGRRDRVAIHYSQGHCVQWDLPDIGGVPF